MGREKKTFAVTHTVDPKSAALADRRTGGLLNAHIMQIATVQQLVRSAYLQGLNDAIEVAASGQQ